MNVNEVMTAGPACCTPDTPLKEVASLMVENDCGGIPVVENEARKRPIGMVTDRDIVVRAVANNINPLEKTAVDCMTKPIVTVTPETPVEKCSELMEEKQIRRVLVLDEKGELCGIVSLADIARHSGQNAAGELVKEVSEPTKSAAVAG